MCFKRACFGIWLIEQGTLLLKRACFALWHITNCKEFTIRINQAHGPYEAQHTVP